MTVLIPDYAMFGSIGMDHIIGELCYEGTILQRNYSAFVKFHGKSIWEPQHHHVICYIQIYVIMRCVIKGLHSYKEMYISDIWRG